MKEAPITPIYAKFNMKHIDIILFPQGCQKFPGTAPRSLPRELMKSAPPPHDRELALTTARTHPAAA